MLELHAFEFAAFQAGDLAGVFDFALGRERSDAILGEQQLSARSIRDDVFEVGMKRERAVRGSVQGVVVQMTALTSGAIFAASLSPPLTIGNFTQIDGLVWSSYSTSASASAVRS